jgi:hypothetical protein
LNEVLEVLQIRGIYVKLLQVLEDFQKSISVSADHIWRQHCMKLEQHFDAVVVKLRAVLNARYQGS